MNLSLLPVAEISAPEEAIDEVLPWVLEAGNPYFEWLFGSPAEAIRVLTHWMMRKSSEIWIQRASLLQRDGNTVGGFLALSAADLLRCRKSDTIALMRDIAPEKRAAALERLNTSRGLFAPPEEGEFYLSKMGVLAGERGKGLGRHLVEAFMETGRRAGFRQFRLDVWADNHPAVHLYRSMGFHEVERPDANQAPLSYLSMVWRGDDQP
jgi:ribosomal protein S18 acetylase RimI-like enzyme